MRNIEILVNDGLLGQKSLLLAISAFATGNLNSKLKKESPSYKMADILPLMHEYIVPELTPEEKSAQVNNSLMAFVQRSPGAPKKVFGG